MKARRRPVVDLVEREGESVVLVGRRVVRLSALATALLEACEDWADEGALVAVLVTRFGAPPDGADAALATRAALSQLDAEGLVELA